MSTRDDFLKSSESKKSNEERYSIIRNREILNDGGYHSAGGPVTRSYEEQSDNYYGVASNSDMILRERHKNDVKLRKRCAVIITPTKELIQYQRKRYQLYNEILQKQRRKLELRALEKQREKECRRLGCLEEKSEQNSKFINREEATTPDKKSFTSIRRTRNYSEIFMSSESEYETNFKVRTRKPRPANFKELAPLQIQIEKSEATTTKLPNQIDTHLDAQPATERNKQIEINEQQAINKNDINQQTCDITNDKDQPKLRELNLLADIAQHLSPYQLDLPENSNNPSRTASPAPEAQSLLLATRTPREMIKEKITVTEHLIIQSLDNLLVKTKPQLNDTDQQREEKEEEEQQQTYNSYAHEPKLNVAANFKSSPLKFFLQNHTQQNSTQLQSTDSPFLNSTSEKETNSKAHTDETSEPILVENSIKVVKPITSSFNSQNETSPARSQTLSDSSIPILISNVESLNHFEEDDDTAKRKPDNKMHLISKDATKTNSESAQSIASELLAEETNEGTKDIAAEQNGNFKKNESADMLPSTNLNVDVESSIVCTTDVANIPSETEISKNLTASSLRAADLVDVSLESEMSKPLPESSNDSEVAKSVDRSNPVINNSTADQTVATDKSIPELSSVMPNITKPPTLSTSQQESSGDSFDLVVSREEELSSNSTNDSNTPLKFAKPPELEDNKTPLKNTLESDTDSNVAKFLDLILSKTVTDAESETRDKIIKELNALTEDPTPAATSGTDENNCNNEINQPELKLTEDKSNKAHKENKTREENQLEKKATILKEQTNSSTGDYDSQPNFEENSSESHIENNCPVTEIAKTKTNLKELNIPETPSANNDLNPPKENPKNDEVVSDVASPNELLSDIMPLKPLNRHHKMKLTAITPTVNVKCRVRLKRVNLYDHFKGPKKETWTAIPITKSKEPVSSISNILKCDTIPEKISTINKSCLKSNKHANEKLDDGGNVSKNISNITTVAEIMPSKKSKLEVEPATSVEATELQAPISQQPPIQIPTQPSQPSATSPFNSTSTTKPKSKPSKTVTFDLSNLNEEPRDTMASNHKQKSKSHTAGTLGCYLRNSRPPRKLPDNTLRAAETLQLFVNTINDSARTPPPAEFNKKRSPIKNKCIAEDETPRPPPTSTLMGTPPCKKTCTEKSRSQITSSKCKDQFVSSLTTPPSISSITSDITTARIYTSSPLDQTLPEYDDNVDTVADSELILPTTSGSLRRKLKRPKKSLARPEPVDDISTDDISNQPECNGEDDADAVVDNEDDVFAEELLPIPAANEHILEDIVSARPPHIGAGSVIRDDYMNIEATATVPVYLFNDESRDLPTPEPIQSSDTTNVVDSSSYLNTSSSTTANTAVAARANSVMGSLEKSMLSPSEHEVSSTQETFYQTPIKNNKQTEIFGEKSLTSKDKGNIGSGIMNSSISKQKHEDKNYQNKDDCQTSSTTGLLQNNQVDTTNHSPEMCTLTLTGTTTTTTTLTSNRKNRKASTHDEILFNELQQQQLPPNKRKSTTTTSCAESTSDNNSSDITSKNKVVSNNLDVKSNGSFVKVEDKFKKLLKEVCKRDKSQAANELDVRVVCASNNGEGGSSPSTTTTINEEKLSRSKRKRQKSSKSKKTKSHSERSSKIMLKASKLTPHVPASPLIITIPKSRLLRPLSTPTPPTPIESQDKQQPNEFLDMPDAKLFIGKGKDMTTTKTEISRHRQHQHNHDRRSDSLVPRERSNTSFPLPSKSTLSQSPVCALKTTSNVKEKISESGKQEVICNANSTTMPKGKSSSRALAKKNKEKLNTKNNMSSSITTSASTNNNDLIFVKDKYDLIKSKDKYNHHDHHHHNNHNHLHGQQVIKEKSRATPNNARLHKSSTKEKIKGEMLKEKHKAAENLVTQQELHTLKANSSQSKIKSLSFLATATTPSSSTNKTKQTNSKSSKSSSSSSTPLTSAIHKSKTNLSSTQSSTATTGNATGSSHTTTATLSTHNVRKKLKIK